MQCIMSCKFMSGTKNIGNNRMAKRIGSNNCDTSLSLGSYPIAPNGKQSGSSSHLRGSHPPGRTEFQVDTTTHQTLSRSLQLRTGNNSTNILQLLQLRTRNC
ncbi:hypothetical protein F511_09101 [Dorcoceras hygrometricum]|uniref:Uncharacterized protein n=1 Tax=Dorcoceras hygrometricum TaxID=472368 RepID=A0A2Z7CY96_9LAMI|nr:hypothetical protein F511_09101 [Dorcoceras hygrometricum]